MRSNSFCEPCGVPSPITKQCTGYLTCKFKKTFETNVSDILQWRTDSNQDPLHIVVLLFLQIQTGNSHHSKEFWGQPVLVDFGTGTVVVEDTPPPGRFKCSGVMGSLLGHEEFSKEEVKRLVEGLQAKYVADSQKRSPVGGLSPDGKRIKKNSNQRDARNKKKQGRKVNMDPENDLDVDAPAPPKASEQHHEELVKKHALLEGQLLAMKQAADARVLVEAKAKAEASVVAQALVIAQSTVQALTEAQVKPLPLAPAPTQPLAVHPAPTQPLAVHQGCSRQGLSVCLSVLNVL
jgi:hypothetical protein